MGENPCILCSACMHVDCASHLQINSLIARDVLSSCPFFFFLAHALTVSVRLGCRPKLWCLNAVRDCILKSTSSFGKCFQKGALLMSLSELKLETN